MIWFLYLIVCIAFEIVALILAPVLPLFYTWRSGWCNNRSQWLISPRLPTWLSWFDTPDNSLFGDAGHQKRHAGSSFWWQATCWLSRNRAYGFKWSVLSAPILPMLMEIHGNPSINRNNGQFGLLKIRMGRYWQWKMVKPIRWTGLCIMFNFGWLLDDISQERGLFLFSPRICLIK